MGCRRVGRSESHKARAGTHRAKPKFNPHSQASMYKVFVKAGPGPSVATWFTSFTNRIKDHILVFHIIMFFIESALGKRSSWIPPTGFMFLGCTQLRRASKPRETKHGRTAIALPGKGGTTRCRIHDRRPQHSVTTPCLVIILRKSTWQSWSTTPELPPVAARSRRSPC